MMDCKIFVLVLVTAAFALSTPTPTWGHFLKPIKNIVWPGDLAAATSPSVGRVPHFLFQILKHKFDLPKLQKVTTTPEPASRCICVPYYLCDSNNTIITTGVGVIDVRFRRCTGDLEVCCRMPNVNATSPLPIPTAVPTAAPTMAPTRPPTMAPTMAPTMPPTMPPTMAPTMPPTMPPTMAPTMPPTMPPTMAPTMPPTMPPTMAPTMPPTMAPTMPPTVPITVFPTSSPNVNCLCVERYQCDASGVIIISGAGLIDPRQQGLCPIVTQVCCRIPGTSVVFPTLMPQITSVTPVSPIQMCVCVRTWQCDSTGFIIVSGAGSIDPRFPIGRQGQLGSTCPTAEEICCRIPPNGQDSAAGFPPNNPQPSSGSLGPIRNPGTDRACICVNSLQCMAGFVVSQDGAGIIDPRFGICPLAQDVCCRLQGILVTGTQSIGKQTMAITGVATPASDSCGIRGTMFNAGQPVADGPGATLYAEFPWMVAILVRQNGAPLLFQCGGSLLTSRSVLTAAHCISEQDPSKLVVRVGEWDTRSTNEPLPFQEIGVQVFVKHPQFYSGGLYHDVALVILTSEVTYQLNVRPICLPQQGMVLTPGIRCFATGWGRNSFGVEGQYQAVLRQVDLPIVAQSECQSRLRSTRLGQYFQLHGSFMCAGGEMNKDTCRGDGGGPLVCPTSTGRYVQVGIVSWGIGCGASFTPAVYASVPQHRQWIDQQLANYGVF